MSPRASSLDGAGPRTSLIAMSTLSPRLFAAVALVALGAGVAGAALPAQAGSGALTWDASGPPSLRSGTTPFAAVLVPTLAAEALPTTVRGDGPPHRRPAASGPGRTPVVVASRSLGPAPLLFGAAGADRCRLVCAYRL